MRYQQRTIVLVGLLVAALAFAFGDVLLKLVHDWATDDNYSHGFLVPPIAAYLVWERRHRLRSIAIHPSWLGLLAVVGSTMLLGAGVLGAEMFLTRVALVGMLGGIVVFTLGWRHLRVLLFPLAFLLLMIPLPAIIFNQLAFPLQLLASTTGAAALTAVGVPVLREGNVMVLANTTLEVAEACSGIRSLMSLVTLAVVFGYFADRRMWVRTALVVSAIPVAIAANALRVSGTGVAAYWYGPEAAEGFLHTFSGWLMFVAAFAMLLAIQRSLVAIFPQFTAKPAVSTVIA